MREFLDQIGNLMAELAILAEGKTAGGFDKPQVSQGEGETGLRPPGPSSTDFDRALSQLREWFAETSRVLDRAKKTPAQVDWRSWIIDHYEGEHYTVVAVEEKVHPTYIRKIRVEARRNPNDGSRKLEAA